MRRSPAVFLIAARPRVNDRRSLNSAAVDNGLKLESDTPSRLPAFQNLFMNGSEVFKFAVRTLPQVPRNTTSPVPLLLPGLSCPTASCGSRSAPSSRLIAPLPQTLKDSLKNAGLEKDDLDWLVCHQVRTASASSTHLPSPSRGHPRPV